MNNNSIPQLKLYFCCQPIYQEIRANRKDKERTHLQATKDDSFIKSIEYGQRIKVNYGSQICHLSRHRLEHENVEITYWCKWNDILQDT